MIPKKQLQFELTEFKDDPEFMRIPATENYDYWLLLMEYFLAKSDTFEIHCFTEEVTAIREITSDLMGLFESKEKQGMTIFTGFLTADIMKFLLTRHLIDQKRLAWFSVFLISGDQLVFTSEHWGTEFFVPDVTEEDLLFIKHVAPDETTFDHYEEN
ncbi:hypothetical protein [Planococcus sp. S3-L1]|uniref:hypothetical protein n=1 Tax=Planococcus sp. S3-L1 TaxID=3046200 RepID=UPI0024BA38DE|nr:hypothetical protein [Planococcus sp. S3-L1]MDJ0331368.1 hypothetical protein [Planococcus sp. S3-L1]